MSPVRILAVAIGILLAAGLVVLVRHEHAQTPEASTFEPGNMKEFKKPQAVELKKKLSAEQFAVTQQRGTEPPSAMPIGTLA